MILEIFAFIVMLVMLVVVIWLVTLLGPLPGKIAAQRQHSQEDAIRVLGWIGLITLGVTWFAALVWAYVRTDIATVNTQELEKKVTMLEQKLEALTQGGSES